MKRKVLFSILIIAFFGFSLAFNLNQKRNDDKRLVRNIEALAFDQEHDCPPECNSWGYKNWDYWASGASGVDCCCNDREKVWTEC